MRIQGFASAAAMGGLALITLSTPIATADTDVCSAGGIAGTVNTVTGAAQQYLVAHPGAGQVLTAAIRQSPAEAQGSVRGYFTANPKEYFELRGILAPIGDVQRQCNVAVLPPALEAAYDQFMAG